MTQVNIEVGKVSDLLYDLMTSTKATKFRAGFTKVNGEYRVGKFDLLNRKTWKQTDGTMYKRKGKKRTTDPDEYILAHDLEKKVPREASSGRCSCHHCSRQPIQHQYHNHTYQLY